MGSVYMEGDGKYRWVSRCGNVGGTVDGECMLVGNCRWVR